MVCFSTYVLVYTGILSWNVPGETGSVKNLVLENLKILLFHLYEDNQCQVNL